MKQTLICLFSLALIFGGALFAQEAETCEIYSPTGMQDKIVLDYHPEYGTVGKYDMPMERNGWNPNDVNLDAMFPGERIVSYELQNDTFTGTALVEHKAPDGTVFYVWHEYENEPVVLVRAVAERVTDDVTVTVSVWKLHVSVCSNGVWSIWWG